MSYEISKFPFKAELASASFNAKFEEIETYINNLSSEVETLRTENQELRQLLNNKVDKNKVGVDKIDDALTVEKTGIYWCANAKNTPEEHGSLINIIPWNSDLNYKTLIFISSQTAKLYTRNRFNGHWSAWVEK